MSALPVLVITREGEMLRSLALESEISIGRGDGNVIRLEDRAVSRRHAVVRKTSEGIQIEKQSDFAPIRLNGAECTRALLKEGDVVEIGPYRMRLEGKKEEKKEERKAAPAPVMSALTDIVAAPTPSHSAFEPGAADGDSPTIVLGDEFAGAEGGMPEPLPTDLTMATTEVPPANVLSDLGAELSGDLSELARPIEADAQGAETSSQDPGTNIFGESGSSTDPLPDLNIDFGAIGSTIENEPGPSEISGTFDEDAATRVLHRSIDARLDIPDGKANVKSIDLDQDEIVIGRGKECDVVLNDKKSSRKNTIIAKVGNRYVVRDLDSSNGTYVNGESVKERELSADDVIRIGEVEIHFVALNPDYEKKRSHFLPVDPGPISAPFSAPGGHASDIPATPIPGLGAPASGFSVATPERKGLGGIYEKYIRNFGSLRPLQKLLVVLSLGLFLSWYFEEELGLVETASPPVKVAKKNPGGTSGAVDYDQLSPEKRAQIDEAVRKATDFLRQMDFDRAINEVQQMVYPILPEYPQAKEIERYATEGKRRKEAIAEEVRKREEEEALKVRIAELEKDTRTLMAQKKYEAAKETFSEILSLDPENPTVAEWKKEIEAWMEEQSRLEQERLVQEEINKRGWDTYNEAFDLHKAGKYREAIPVYRKITELGATDEGLLKKVKTMIKTCQDSIRDLREPHLRKAKTLEAARDLAAAFKEFQIATEIDPTHPDGWAGMERIRDVLTDRAKILYTEAVIAESYSDFKTAHSKFNEIMKLAPEGSLYYQRAQRKLQSYLNFKQEEEEVIE
jgi:pSer/pThr/pTyr-binding forkhead associated (FHA) protein/tetratricopeptide (TPR) repeat protein